MANSRAPSLRGHYSASSLLRAPPPPSRLPPISQCFWLYGFRLRRFRDGTRRVSPVAQPALVTVLPLLPRRSVSPRQSVCDDPCCLRPEAGGSASRSIVFRGHLWVYLRCGPVTRLPSRGWLCQSASSVSFPPRMRPKLRGPDYYPGETYLPLNMSAFLGHTASSQSKTHQEQCILKSSLTSGPNLSVVFEWPDAQDFFVTG